MLRNRVNAFVSPLRHGVLLLLLSAAATPLLANGAPLDFFTVTPCRVYDSRGTDGPLDMGLTFTAQTGTDGILVAGVCGVAADAVAAAFNVTIVGATESGELLVFPAGQAPPPAGATPFSAGRTRAMLEIVPLGSSGASTGRVDALATVTPPTNPGPDQYQLILDVTGYFRPPDAPVVTTTGGTTAFTEDGGPVVVDSGVTVTDPDDTNLQSATVSLASAPDGGAETLAVNSPGTNCSGLLVTPGNPLTITGNQPLATYQTCLQSVTYNNTDQDPDTADRTVEFVANDGANNSNTATKTVSVAAINDPPSITSSATPSVPENTTAVIDVQSTDPEGDTEGSGLTYSLTGGADQSFFSIVPTTGVLTFATAPDFDNPQDAGANNVYDVQVTVTDSGLLTDVQNLQVTVTGANEPPTITSSATPSVPENTTAVIDVQSTDPDGDTEGSGLTYSLTGGADQSFFSIVPATGVLTFNSAPDFENPQDAGANNVYDVQVTVTDSGSLTDVQNLQVTVTNANEPPTITSSATPSAAENQTSVIDVQSTDPEGDTEGSGLTYSLTGGADQSFFSIVPATGVLTFNSPPNFEAPADAGANNVYDVQVTVTDSGTLTGVQNLQVTVTNVNEAPTITSSATPSAAENQTSVIDVQSTDPDGDTEGSGLSYSITGGADAALFSIVPATGVLTFNSAPDFENPQDSGANNVYDVQVTVTDSGTLTDVQNLQVTVTNANEPPTITSSATPSVAENQTAVIDVQSTDPDGDTEGSGLTYSITGGADAAQFSIVPATGVLTFNSAPNFEAPADAGANNVYDVQVTVTDSGTLTDVQNLQVTVTNVNEAPTITSSATPSAPENQTAVIDVQSTDPEGDTEGSGLTYSITGGADAALFSIVPSTGVLTFNSAPNFEAPADAGANNVYDFQVTVTDSGSQTGVQNLQVTVTNVNEAPTANPDGANITEEAPNVAAANTVSGNVLTNDTDPDAGTTLTVSAVNGSGPSVGNPVAGTYGSVTINSNGGFTYTLDDTNPTVNALNVGGMLTDTFNYTASDGSLTSSSMLTVTIHGADDPPTPDNDAWDFLGNTQLEVDRDTASTPEVIENTGGPPELGVLEGDVDPDGGPAITISGIVGCGDLTAPFDCVLAGQGTVSLQADGSLSFIPEPGDTDPTATFQYTLTGNPTPATVTVTRFERVWYVDPTAGAGNGTSASPFNALTSLNGAGGAGDSDVAGDYIFIHDGTLAGSIEMENNEHLVGEGAGLSIPVNLNGNGSPTNLVSAGTKPQLTNASGDTVKITTQIPIEIIGLSLASGTGNAIDLTSGAALTGSSTLAISNDEFRGAAAEGIDVNMNASTTGTLNLNITNNNWDLAGAHAGNAVDVNRVAGTLNLNFSANTNIKSNATAVMINGGAAASTTITGFSTNNVHGDTLGAGVVISNATFDAVPGGAVQQVDGDNLMIGTSGNPVGSAGMSLSGVTGNLFFDDLDVFAGTSGLDISGVMTFAVTPASPDGSGTSTIDADNGPALTVASATIDLRLDDLDSTTSTSGVSLTSVAGQFKTDSDASITKSSGGGTAFSVATSSATVTYAGTLNVTSGSGVALTSNTGTSTFSGGMTLSTGTNTGFSASGGGTVNVIDPPGLANNAVTTTTGTAVNISGTTIGASNATFESVNSTTAGANTTIILANTGTGQFMVTGTAGSGTGGTISNKTVDAVTLNNTDGLVTFKNMILQDLGDMGGGFNTISNDDAIQGQDVDGGMTLDGMIIRRISDEAIHGATLAGNAATVWNGLSITNSTFEDTNRFGQASVGDANNEGMVRILGIRGTVNLTNNIFQRGGELIDFFVTGGTLNMTAQTNNFNFAYKEFTSGPFASVGAHCVDVTVQSSGNANVTLGDRNNDALDNNFLNCRLGSIRVASDAGATGNVDVVIGKNDFTVNDHSSGVGGDFDFPMGGVLLSSQGTDSVTFDAIVDGNFFDEITNASGGVGQLTLAMQNGAWQVLVEDNTFDTPGNAPWFLRADSTTSAKVLFQNNIGIKGAFCSTDPAAAGGGCDLGAGQLCPGAAGYCGPGLRTLADLQNSAVLDLTIINDHFAEHDAGFDPGQTFEGRVLNTGGGGTLCLDLQNNQAPDGYSVEEFAGNFNLVGSGTCPVGSPSPSCQTLLGNRGNRGGGNVATTNPPFVNVEVGSSITVVAGPCQQPSL